MIDRECLNEIIEEVRKRGVVVEEEDRWGDLGTPIKKETYRQSKATTRSDDIDPMSFYAKEVSKHHCLSIEEEIFLAEKIKAEKSKLLKIFAQCPYLIKTALIEHENNNKLIEKTLFSKATQEDGLLPKDKNQVEYCHCLTLEEVCQDALASVRMHGCLSDLSNQACSALGDKLSSLGLSHDVVHVCQKP